MASAGPIVLPGDEIPSDTIPKPSGKSATLKLGPGLRHVPPSTIVATIAGQLSIDRRKGALWVENNSGRYVPQTHDLVLATVHHSSGDFFACTITPFSPSVQLPHLAFENATRKTRPQLPAGSLVYAKVSAASKFLDTEIACVNVSTGKGEGMGELKGGMVFDVSLGMARRLLMARQREDGGIVVLEEMAEKVPFEVAVGRNGRVWVNAATVREVLCVGRALREVDEGALGIEGQQKVVRRLLRDL